LAAAVSGLGTVLVGTVEAGSPRAASYRLDRPSVPNAQSRPASVSKIVKSRHLKVELYPEQASEELTEAAAGPELPSVGVKGSRCSDVNPGDYRMD
jgi:hypothetical protein